jgi:hypothetical protein
MKYFTPEWYSACQNFDTPEETLNKPIDEYKTYYNCIKKSLPKKLRKFNKHYSLHDASLHWLNFDPQKRRLILSFQICIVKKKVILGQYATLRYKDVTHFISTESYTNGHESSGSFEFLSYNEIELIDTDLFEHRLFFAPDIEMTIRFRNFDYST